MNRSKPELWQRFQKYYTEFPTLGLAIDLSRMNFGDDFLASMQTPMQKAFIAMADELINYRAMMNLGVIFDLFANMPNFIARFAHVDMQIAVTDVTEPDHVKVRILALQQRLHLIEKLRDRGDAHRDIVLVRLPRREALRDAFAQAP